MCFVHDVVEIAVDGAAVDGGMACAGSAIQGCELAGGCELGVGAGHDWTAVSTEGENGGGCSEEGYRIEV